MGWLVLAPLVVLVSVWSLMRWRRNRQAAANDQPNTSAQAPEMTDVEPARLNLLAAALRAPAGETPGEALKGLMKPQTPKLHDTLRDARGLPLFAAPVSPLTATALDAVT
ncbi:MAG: hypothetical protein RLN92_00030, partial [Alloalcanivorax xenomutans]